MRAFLCSRVSPWHQDNPEGTLHLTFTHISASHHISWTDLFVCLSVVFQLEDDVIAKNGYYNDMKAFTKQDVNNQWLFVEFSQLGFIGVSLFVRGMCL